VNDLSVSLSREETVGRLRVTVVDERVQEYCGKYVDSRVHNRNLGMI